jgi:hypothetical protein
VAGCTDAHAELEELGGVVGYLGEAVPLVEPPASLRGRVLAAAAADQAATRGSAAAVTEPTAPPRPTALPGTPSTDGPMTRPTDAAGLTATPTAPPAGTVVSLDAARARRRDWRPWVLGLAAVIAIVALGAWNVSLRQDLDTTKAYQQKLSAAIVQASQPGSQVAVLSSTSGPGGPGGIAVMPATGQGTLLLTNLAPTTGGHVYVAWAIPPGQPPEAVGSFTVGSDGVGYFDDMPQAVGIPITVAVTLEEQPKPPAPTTQPVSAGTAPPPSQSA